MTEARDGCAAQRIGKSGVGYRKIERGELYSYRAPDGGECMTRKGFGRVLSNKKLYRYGEASWHEVPHACHIGSN